MPMPSLNTENPFQYVVISTATTTVIPCGPGVFGGVNVVTAGTGSAITIYDNTAASGNLLAPAAAATTAVGQPANVFLPPTGIALQKGLTIVTTGSPAAVVNVYFISAIP